MANTLADAIATASSVTTSFVTSVAAAPVPTTANPPATSANTTTSLDAVPSVWLPSVLPTLTGSLSLPQATPGEVYITSGFNGYTAAVDVILYYNELSSSALTPPTGCNNTYLSILEPDATANTLAATTSFLYGGGCSGRAAGYMESCLPNGALPLSNARVNVSPNVVVETHAVYSPAAGCPVGYTSGCTLGGLQAGATKSGESAIGCCPEYVSPLPFLCSCDM